MTELPVSNGHRTEDGNSDEHTTTGAAGAGDCLYCWIGDRTCTGRTKGFTAISGRKRASATEDGAGMVLLQQNQKLPSDAGGVEGSWYGREPTGSDGAVLCWT